MVETDWRINILMIGGIVLVITAISFAVAFVWFSPLKSELDAQASDINFLTNAVGSTVYCNFDSQGVILFNPKTGQPDCLTSNQMFILMLNRFNQDENALVNVNSRLVAVETRIRGGQ